jgi:hypothetical protein
VSLRGYYFGVSSDSESDRLAYNVLDGLVEAKDRSSVLAQSSWVVEGYNDIGSRVW